MFNIHVFAAAIWYKGNDSLSGNSQVDWFMVSNVTFNNISVISWRSLLMVEETRVPDILYHIMLYRLHLVMKGVRTHNIRGTDCTGSCKSNYHTFTTTTAPSQIDSLSYQTKHYEKRGSNNVDQHFYQYQQNEQLSITSNNITLKWPRHMTLQIRVLVWYRHTHLVEINQLTGSQPSHLNNWISNGNSYINIKAMIVWSWDLQLPMQSVHITIDDVSSNLYQDEAYNIMWLSLSVTCDRSVVFSVSFGLLQQ
jgi:hypothetical protein